MASGRSNDRFSFFDLPRALWLFLGEERWTFVFFSSVLLVVLGYTLVPPFVVGFTANFLIEWLRSDAAARPSRPAAAQANCSTRPRPAPRAHLPDARP